MKLKIIGFIIFSIIRLNSLLAQDTAKSFSRWVRYEVIDGDTFFVYAFDEFVLKDFNDSIARAKYKWLVRNVKIALPYAKLTAFKLQMIEDNLNQLKTKRAREKYIKQHEKALKEDFEAKLKNLSVNQGKLLMKLIHRETGQTTYQILKHYRGSSKAFMWQTFAKFYGSDTKETYDPVEDYQIEHIIRTLEIEDK